MRRDPVGKVVFYVSRVETQMPRSGDRSLASSATTIATAAAPAAVVTASAPMIARRSTFSMFIVIGFFGLVVEQELVRGSQGGWIFHATNAVGVGYVCLELHVTVFIGTGEEHFTQTEVMHVGIALFCIAKSFKVVLALGGEACSPGCTEPL